MPKIEFKRGLKTNLPTLNEAEPAFTTDTEEFFIGSKDGNIQFAKQKDLDSTNTQVTNNTNTLNNLANVNANAEVMTARGTYPLLGNRLDNVDVSLAERATSLNAFPRLAGEVDDTARIIRCFNFADANKIKEVLIPAGTYTISSTIDLTGKLYNCVINGYGATIQADGVMTTPMILMNDNGMSLKCRLVKILGLTLDGNYKAIGLHINSAQEWTILGMSFNNCVIGLRLQSTFYGYIGEETIFYQCMTGIEFYASRDVSGHDNVGQEVNAIGMDNIKFYGFNTTTKQLFTPKNAGETDDAYNLRVVSKGVSFKSQVLDIDFYKFTFEFYDYGFYGFDVSYTYVINPVFSITSCYFERITIAPIFMDNITSVIQPVSKMSQCIRQTSGDVFLATGHWTYIDNDNTRQATIQLKSSQATGSVCKLITDVPRSSITNNFTLSTPVIIQGRHIPITMNDNAYGNFGSTSGYPSQQNEIPTLEDTDYQEGIGFVTNVRIKNKYVKQSFTKPLAFVGKKSAPIIKGTDSNFYAITTDGTNLILKKVLNTILFETPYNYLYAKELYTRTDWTEGQQMGCIETGELYTYKSGKWTNNLSGVDYTAIGKGSDLTSVPLAYNGNRKVWNVSTDSGYGSSGSYWGYVDVWGNFTDMRTNGTLAQRPANPGIDKFTYYATDNSTYYIWSVSGAAWSTFTPLV